MNTLLDSLPGQIRAALGTAAERQEPNSYELAILNGLQSKPVYQGTVDPHVVAARRVKNRQARRSHRINRMVARRG